MNANSRTSDGTPSIMRRIAPRRSSTAKRAGYPLSAHAGVSVETQLAADLYLYARRFKRPLAA